MSWIDIAILVILAVSTLIAIMRGFVKEAISLASWVVAFIVSLNFSPHLAPLLPDFVSAPLFRQGLAWFLLFAGTMFVGGLINFIVNSFIDKAGLSGTNRALGTLFGAIRGVLVICALILLGALMEMPKTNWWQSAKLLPYFETVTLKGLEMMPEDISKKFDFTKEAAPNEGDAQSSDQPAGLTDTATQN